MRRPARHYSRRIPFAHGSCRRLEATETFSVEPIKTVTLVVVHVACHGHGYDQSQMQDDRPFRKYNDTIGQKIFFSKCSRTCAAILTYMLHDGNRVICKLVAWDNCPSRRICLGWWAASTSIVVMQGHIDIATVVGCRCSPAKARKKKTKNRTR
ncbi:hypothetical protein BX600DRAFT_445427 [Xylariales sp. PMI_506]|nr:hypothetical protein BX600DRAFT_445427 [Xylariales sp. PMI_506]